MHRMDLLAIFLVFCVASSGLGSGLAVTPSIFNVVKFGAIGNGRSDDSTAFIKAWRALCGATGVRGIPILTIPQGKTFLLRPVSFQGPCKSTKVHVQVLGSIVAPNTMAAWTDCDAESWLSFSNVSSLIVDGTGQINGRGSLWWSHKTNNINVKPQCSRPTALRFHNCNNLQLSGLNHFDSPKNHITINNCKGVTISNLHITAPQDSPNTDGIDISSSTQVNIHDCNIKTGDDCIAIKTGSSFINITRVACGPGHGISVGGLGENGAHDTVEEVQVRDCSFSGTENGARIKTWKGGSGYARKISFEKITLLAAKNPIIIDQFYCDGGHNCTTNAAVQVSDVTYSGVRGTSASLQAIALNCDKKIGCTNIVMNQINITSSIRGKKIFASCNNAHGTSSYTTPNVPCLSKLPILS